MTEKYNTYLLTLPLLPLTATFALFEASDIKVLNRLIVAELSKKNKKKSYIFHLIHIDKTRTKTTAKNRMKNELL